MLIYKIDILEALKNAGYSSYKLRKEKLISEAEIQKMRVSPTEKDFSLISKKTLDLVCRLLACQPGDLIAYVPDDKD